MFHIVLKIVLLLVVIAAIIAIFTNFSPQAKMDSTIQTLQTSVTTIAYAGEFDDIRKAVDEFLVLRTALGTEDDDLLASKIDQRINKLGLVKNYCTQKISTLELAYAKDPYEKIQQICPALKNISFVKAIQLFRLI